MSRATHKNSFLLSLVKSTCFVFEIDFFLFSTSEFRSTDLSSFCLPFKQNQKILALFLLSLLAVHPHSTVKHAEWYFCMIITIYSSASDFFFKCSVTRLEFALAMRNFWRSRVNYQQRFHRNFGKLRSCQCRWCVFHIHKCFKPQKTARMSFSFNLSMKRLKISMCEWLLPLSRAE